MSRLMKRFAFLNVLFIYFVLTYLYVSGERSDPHINL